MTGAESSTSRSREGTVPLGSTRRKFLESISRSAMVLPLERLLSFLGPCARIGDGPAVVAEKTPFGVNFVNVAKESGLRATTTFGGEHKNKYLLETTGCVVAFYASDKAG